MTALGNSQIACHLWSSSLGLASFLKPFFQFRVILINMVVLIFSSSPLWGCLHWWGFLNVKIIVIFSVIFNYDCLKLWSSLAYDSGPRWPMYLSKMLEIVVFGT